MAISRFYSKIKFMQALAVAKRIRQIRDVLGVDQTQLARALGVTSQAVHNWEVSGKIKESNAAALAKLANTTTDWIYREVGNGPSAPESIPTTDDNVISVAAAISITVIMMSEITGFLLSDTQKRYVIEEIQEFYMQDRSNPESAKFVAGIIRRALRQMV